MHCSSSRESKTQSATGSWHEASTLAGTGMNTHDMQVKLNDCGPRAFKVYASSSADLLTAQEGMCDEIDPPLVEVVSQPPIQGQAEGELEWAISLEEEASEEETHTTSPETQSAESTEAYVGAKRSKA